MVDRQFPVDMVAGFQSALYEVLCRAQALGQLRPGHDPLALAHFFATLSLGLTVASKQSADPTVLRNAVQIALSVFETTAVPDSNLPEIPTERGSPNDRKRGCLPRCSPE